MKQKEETGKPLILLYFAVIFSVIVIDQFSKFLVSRSFSFGSYPIIDNFIYITLVRNTGAAFGMLKGFNFILALITFAVIAAAGRYLFVSKDRFANIALCLIIGGAIGNLTDRIVFGYVVDFIDVGFWPVFNLADSAVTVGVGLLAISIFKPKL